MSRRSIDDEEKTFKENVYKERYLHDIQRKVSLSYSEINEFYWNVPFSPSSYHWTNVTIRGVEFTVPTYK